MMIEQRGYRARKLTNLLGSGLAVTALVVALIPLGAMLFYVFSQGGSALRPEFFTNLPTGAGEAGGGMANAIVGTLILILIASAIGLPFGILTGIYLYRAGSGSFAQIVRFVTDVIAGTPSIIAGVVAYALVVVTTKHFSATAGGVALALLMFPTVARATEESLKIVPDSVKEAGLALGLPEWKTTFSIVLPTAATGIVTAMMLGIARIAGETAPLVFTVFGNPNMAYSPFGTINALPLQIWNFAQQPYPEWHTQAWEGAFVLFMIVLLMNLSARILTHRLYAKASTA